METIDIEGKTIYLAFPDELKIPWIGDKQYLSQIQSAWVQEKDSEHQSLAPFNPKIIARAGMGKTTLAHSSGKIFIPNSPSEVFILHCSKALNVDQALIHKVKTENQTEYHASPLVTAMIKGGICVIDECQFLPSESWAALSTLLDQRYIFSDLTGLKIRAHKNFRLCLTENFCDTPDAKNIIPEYISVLLKPVINLNHPSRKHELEVLKYFFPDGNSILLQNMVDFLQSAHFEERRYSIRDCINIIHRYEANSSSNGKKDVDWNVVYQCIRQILDNQAIYFFNDIRNQNKDSDFLFKDDETDLEDDSLDTKSNMDEYYEDEENFAEFIEDDEDDEDDEDIDDSFLFLDESDYEDSKMSDKDQSTIPDSRYLNNLKKKIRNKLKKKRKEKKKKS